MIDSRSANFPIFQTRIATRYFQTRIATRYKAMSATDTVNVVDQGLTDEQRADLAKILQKRKEELLKALGDVDAAIKTLQRKRYPRQEQDVNATESDSEKGQTPNT